MTDPAVYLKPEEVAQMLRLSAKSIYRLVASDPTIPATKIGGSLRFHRERLERWLRSREQGQSSLQRLRPSPNHAPEKGAESA